MNSFILIITIIVSIIGLVISIQTIIETRNKHYEEFVTRKEDEIIQKEISSVSSRQKNANYRRKSKL